MKSLSDLMVMSSHSVIANAKMRLASIFSHVELKDRRIALTAALGVAAVFGVAGTDIGQHALSQLGIRDSVAQTVSAAEKGLQKAGNALNSFIGRSPGERGATDVLKGKAKRSALASGKAPEKAEPAQRALGKIFDQPVEGAPASVVAPPVIALALPDETVAFDAPVEGLPPLASVIPNIVVPGIGGGTGGGGTGGGGGGGGSGGGDPTVTPTVPGVVGSVPEPSTWMLLLFGFGAIGLSLRRAKAGGGVSSRAGLCTKI